MPFSRVFGSAVFFFLAFGMISADGGLVRAQTAVEIPATDLADDPPGADARKAYEKVNAKIAGAGVTGGTVVTFPSGEFEDVGEILVLDKNGTAATTDPAAPAKYITFRGKNTVFTGKIMFNVQNSTYIKIEGFTFRDTKVPDTITVVSNPLPGSHHPQLAAQRDFAVIGSDADGDGATDPLDPAGNGNAAVEVSGGKDENYRANIENAVGVVWLNPSVYDVQLDYVCPPGQNINNIAIRNNRFENTSTNGISTKNIHPKERIDYDLDHATNPRTVLTEYGLSTDADYHECHSSDIEISRNVFTGIGFNGVYLGGVKYLDGTRKVPGHANWASAVDSGNRNAYKWTVNNNRIDGTTWTGIKVNAAFGATLVENNRVSNTAASGIVVGQSSAAADAADAARARITIRSNSVTNSRNDAYFTAEFGQYNGAWTATGDFGGIGGVGGVGGLKALTSPTFTDRTGDALLQPRVFKLARGYDKPFLGKETAASKLLSSIYDDHATGYGSTGVRPDPVTGYGISSDSYTGIVGNIDERPTIVRWFKPGLEAGIELNRITAEEVVVESNELTDNVVGLVVCPSRYCYAAGGFPSLLPSTRTPAAGTLTVPTLKANSIYNNGRSTDMPRDFHRADVVNALTATNTGAGSNVLVLAGNYLGASPEVRGAASTDNRLNEAPPNVGSPETDPPVPTSTGGGVPETDPPVLASTGGVAVTGTTVKLVFSKNLDEDSVPAAAAFTVTQTTGESRSGEITVSGVSVEGMSVTLTLTEAPGSGNSVTVSYDPTMAGSNPVRDVQGNAAAAITGRSVSVSVPPDTGEPGAGGPGTGGGAGGTGTGGGPGAGGGCALASGGSDGIDLGALLPLMAFAALSFGLRRGSKESVQIR